MVAGRRVGLGGVCRAMVSLLRGSGCRVVVAVHCDGDDLPATATIIGILVLAQIPTVTELLGVGLVPRSQLKLRPVVPFGAPIEIGSVGVIDDGSFSLRGHVRSDLGVSVVRRS